MRNSAELERLAAGVHGAAAIDHARAAITGRISPEGRGRSRACHALGLAYNAPRGQWTDVAAHLLGLVAKSRLEHAAVALYDALAAIHHARRSVR